MGRTDRGNPGKRIARGSLAEEERSSTAGERPSKRQPGSAMLNENRAGVREELATKGTQVFLAAEELYRRERVFILQPQRVVLDEQFARLRSESRRLESLLSRKQETEHAHIHILLSEQLRLLTEFKAGIDAAAEIHDYSNYRANR
jgi:hypothetical protein